jgi:NRAMP (natural resistance-associated macrophage protein)-like metal ion transporter
MVFFATLNYGVRILEFVLFVFVGIMSVSIWVETALVSPKTTELMKGWIYGFVELDKSDVFSITGIIGAVVMPHNLYLHTAAVQSRVEHLKQELGVMEKALTFSSIEPVAPIIVTFFVNLGLVSIAAEQVYGSENADSVGLTDFCTYFQSLKGGCVMWAIALLASGQSGAITTTFTGQSVMDGFLNIRLPAAVRAVGTRLLAITPCVIVSILFPDNLNGLVNNVNALLSVLLPFAFTPLVKFNCSESIMGKGKASEGTEKTVLHAFAITVWAINAIALSVEGGGYFGDIMAEMETSTEKVLLILLQIGIQSFYAWWVFSTLFGSIECIVESERCEDEDKETLDVDTL